jgi:hypothetical protein
VLNEILGVRMNVSDESHYAGALGAALFALDRARSRSAPRRTDTPPAKGGKEVAP